MNKIKLLLLLPASLLLCSASYSLDLQGVGFKLTNDTVRYTVKNCRTSNYFPVTYIWNHGQETHYFGLKLEDGLVQQNLKSCIKSMGDKKFIACIHKDWYKYNGPSTKLFKRYHPPIAFYPNIISIDHVFLHTGHNRYERHFFDTNGQEINIDSQRVEPTGLMIANYSIMNPIISKRFSNYDKGWQEFPGNIGPGGSIALSYLRLDKDTENLRCDITDNFDDNKKVSELIGIISSKGKPEWHVTSSNVGKIVEANSLVGDYGEFSYNLTES